LRAQCLVVRTKTKKFADKQEFIGPLVGVM